MFEKAVLSDKTIKKYMRKGKLIATPIGEKQLQPNSVDLTLGNTWRSIRPNATIEGEDCIDVKMKVQYKSGYFECGYNPTDGSKRSQKEFFVLDPGEFVLLASKEVLDIPNGIMAFVQGRSSIARLGIQTEQAGLIDSGFTGTITFEVLNQTKYPIVLYEGMRFAQVYFLRTDKAHMLYGLEKGSKYNGQVSATGSKIHLDF